MTLVDAPRALCNEPIQTQLYILSQEADSPLLNLQHRCENLLFFFFLPQNLCQFPLIDLDYSADPQRRIEAFRRPTFLLKDYPQFTDRNRIQLDLLRVQLSSYTHSFVTP